MNLTQRQIKRLQKTAVECIKHLCICEGMTIKDAEKMVMTTLHESAEYLNKGMVESTITSLRMIHMGETFFNSKNIKNI